MKTIMIMAAAGVAMLAASPVSAAPKCLQLGSIYSWKALDNKTLIVEDDWHQKFKLTLMGYCPNLTFKERLAVKAFGGTRLSCVSKGDSVYTRDFGDRMITNCPIANVEPYTPDMQKADEAAAAAKKAAEENKQQ